MAAEAVIHTRSKKGYLFRLLILALLSEIPYNLALYGGNVNYPERQNVIFTIFFGASACICIEQMIRQLKHISGKSIARIVLYGILTVICLYMPYRINSSYGTAGALAIVIVFMIRKFCNIPYLNVSNIVTTLAASSILTIRFQMTEAMSLLAPLLALPSDYSPRQAVGVLTGGNLQ